ncbi:WYL domain-containing protein [Brevibacterium sandarakinum]|uniref:WYL domain-containing protein n=1 Tax=Brevibacterium sandarakinum TaxID=629680 RepID=UPI00264F580B|nr:WYL domain-containing protein [Brevibacterium sandarakinum]MDN5636427.1 WYL domain-containing protein [Brevibacterium sp.]MDN5656688.1 WYL domain-containing protein [Brevibacterium sandarakinum]
MSSARERLTRLLSLVPYLDAHPGADLEETAAYFNIDSDTLIDDLQLLFVTGRPGHMPDDLIDASWEGGKVYISNAEEVSVPVRLSAEEAGVLVLALELIDTLPGLDTQAVRAAAQKLRLAAGENLHIPVEVSPIPADEELMAFLKQAIDTEAAVEIDYYVGSRDELTRRIIAPSRLLPGADWYLDAWCYSAQAPRRFALSSIRSWTAASHPPMAVSDSQPSAREVTMTLSAAGAWLADELELTDREYLANGEPRVRIRFLVHSVDWLSRFLLCHADVITDIDDREAVDAALLRLG